MMLNVLIVAFTFPFGLRSTDMSEHFIEDNGNDNVTMDGPNESALQVILQLVVSNLPNVV